MQLFNLAALAILIPAALAFHEVGSTEKGTPGAACSCETCPIALKFHETKPLPHNRLVPRLDGQAGDADRVRLPGGVLWRQRRQVLVVHQLLQ